ncbi:MAG: N-6 DNA Methylase [Pelotomaculum sp. PtaB.Bin104]|nr:MAG: N-6 DNA Methylase [Pelotomaculum sp. PtaB.Bin104]
MLEAIVALPENMFYNTSIGTFLWVVTNNKAKERKGKVQLIDATTLKSPLRKNLGDKNCELTPEIRKKIVELYLAFTKADETYSKVFDNEEFAYYSVDILRPLRLRVEITEDRLELLRKDAKDEPLYRLMCKMKDSVGTEPILDYNNFIVEVENAAKKSNIKLTAKRIKAIRNYFTIVDEQAEPVKDNKGGYESDKDLKDNEQIPYKYEGGIEAFYKNEILPYVPDAWIDENSITLGYELSFTKYFYKPVQLREVADIIADIKKIEADTDGLLASIIQLSGGGEW